MKSSLLNGLFIFIIIISNSLNSIAQSENDYEKLWKRVKEFDKDNLPKSASEKVDEIFNLAILQNNEPEILKSTIYRLKYINILEEDGYVKAISKLESEIDSYNGVVKSMMYLFLGTMYCEYYNNYVYQINQRSVTHGFENNDIQTWDKSKFQDKIIKSFYLALDDNLKKVDISEYADIIENAEFSKTRFPSLYDFAAYHAIGKLSGNYRIIDNRLTENAYLTPLHLFINLPVDADSLSFSYSTVKIYQKWLKNRNEDKNNIEALIYTDLERLSFVKNSLATSNKDKIWETTVGSLSEKYYDKPQLAQINYQLASYYNSLGNSYYFRDSTKLQYKTSKIEALKFLNDVITRFPDYYYIGECINLKNEIEKISFGFEVDNIVSIKEYFPIRISFKNTDNVYLSVLKCNYNDYLNLKNKNLNEQFLKDIKEISQIVVSAEAINLPKASDYNEHYTEYLSESLEKGFYIMFMHANPELVLDKNFIARSSIFVSDLSLVYNSDRANSNFYVFDRNTGKPVEKAKVEIYKSEYNYQKRGTEYALVETNYTNKSGYVEIKNIENDYLNARIDVTHKDDFVSSNSYLYLNDDNETSYNSVTFFTDRAIYRPGQTVYFKGICINYSNGKSSIIPKASKDVSLLDANYQEISKTTLTSDEFGSIEGSFTIPLGVLTGYFAIKCNDGSINIMVEEYKRPMFEVTTLPVEGEYRLNDSVYIQGYAKTYAGTALTDAKVVYTVIRNPLWKYYSPFFRLESQEIAFGEAELDDEGKYKIGFKALVDEIEAARNNVYYNYTINISVTDVNGETQSTTSSVFVSNQALVISESFNNIEIREDIDSISIITTNIGGSFIPADVQIEIYKLKDPELLLAARKWNSIDLPLYSKEEWYKKYSGHEYEGENDFSNWNIDAKIYNTKLNTAKITKIKPDGINKWESGVYRIVIQSKDKWGNDIKHTKEVILFSNNDKKMPYVGTSLFYVDKLSAQPGETISAHIGSSYKDTDLIYNLEVQGKILETKMLKLNSEIKKIEIPIEESYRGGITINFMFIKQGHVYSFKQDIDVAWKNKELNLKLITFRDKTLPGSSENWKLKITDNLDNPVNSELMATLYDASLDIFAKNSWSLSTNPYYYSNIRWQMLNSEINRANQNYINFYKDPLYVDIYNPILQFIPMNLYRTMDLYSKKSAVPQEYLEAESLSVMEDGLVLGDIKEESISATNQALGYMPTGDAESQTFVQVRQNFNETVFFYPNLVTNEQGEVLISFTMPESLTRWNFMGLAHTKDLKVGQISASTITQKELMVMPNLPRFFREGDKMQISAKVNNISEGNIAGSSSIEFFDPETLKSLNSEFIDGSNTVDFNVAKNGNALVYWNISIPEGLSAVGVRIIAEGENHSDGEERILPVLTNKMLVTESMPLPVRKSGTTSFTINRLKNSGSSSTLRNYSYTLEYTANPAWYAVQALPYLMEYPYECAEQTFSRFYANSLATHIANSDPKIKRVFEIWKNTPKSTALLSNLEKNEELKALLIEETPWLLDAKDETERKHKLGVLFDLNRMSVENNSAIRKLKDMQRYNGGWPWFEGMLESWYITQHIAGGFGHLDKLGVNGIRKDQSIWEMIKKSVSFIDSEIVKAYNNLKSNCNAECLEKDNISYMQIHYLYVRSFFTNDFPIDESTKGAFEYYKNQAAKYWKNESFYMQGMIALALHRNNDNITPNKIIASLKEHALKSNEMGMYWKYNSGYYWYNAPIETQALLIEVFEEIANDTESVDEMKVWLLKQKQTQDWKTTKATTESIYALLLQGTSLLAETDIPVIKIGDITVDTNSDPEIKAEAGTGYFKKSWDGSQVKPEWGNVSVTKNTNAVSWGAVYWQYFEQLDKITQFEETPLKINKKLFVEHREGNRNVIVPVENDAKLTVGDKVKVRIEIRVDRDMEYVHLKDMRASCFEPVDYLSGYRYKSGLGYYQGIKDASMNFFIDYLRKGTYVFEYDLIVSQKGNFSNGITTMQSMYAPEFTSHSEGVKVVVE